jgi:outer membrane protein assembly factor BamB
MVSSHSALIKNIRDIGVIRGLLPSAKFVMAILIILCLGGGRLVSAASSESEREGSGRNWPLARGDALGTGVARSSLPENPELLWKFEVPKGSFVTTPIVVDGMIYIGDFDGVVRAIDLAGGKEQWKFKSETDDGFKTAAVYRNGMIYIGDVGGTFYCLDAATGKKKWSFKTDGEIDSSANFFKDTVLFGSQDNNFYCLDAKTGKPIWKFALSDQIQCSPTVVADRAFIAGCDGNFHVIDLNKGTEATPPVDIESPSGETPAVRGDTVYFGTEGGTFFAIDWKKGTVLWRWENMARAELIASPAVVPEAVIFASHDRHIRALNPTSGKPIWTFPNHGRVDSSPVVVSNRIFFGSTDGRIYAIDRATGKKVWDYEAGGSFIAAPAVAANRLLIASEDGILYCLGAARGH